MHIVILLAFVLVLTFRQNPPENPPEPYGLAVLVAAVAVYVALAGALAALCAARTLRVLTGPPAPTGRRKRNVLPLLLQAYLLGGLAQLFFLGWGYAVDESWIGQVPLLSEAVPLLPFLAALTLVWLAEYPVHQQMRQRLAERLADEGWRPTVWSRGQFLTFNVRHQFLFIAVPVGLIWLARDFLERNGPAVQAAADWTTARLHVPPLGPAGQETLAVGLPLAASLAVFLVVPVLLVRVWKTSPLPPGELRDDLLHTLRSLRVRCRPPRVWHSGGVIANAGVMGLIAPLRYVLLSDALLTHADRGQVQAVVAHEAGHMQQHHIFYSVLFTLAVIAWGSLLADRAATAWPAYDLVWQSVALLAMAVGWGFGFGWISRRFERQSDVIAAWAARGAGASPASDRGEGVLPSRLAGILPARGDEAGLTSSIDQANGSHNAGETPAPRDARVTPEGVAVFASALRRVAQLNGMSPTASNWRHGSIEFRVNYLMSLAVTNGTREPIDRQVRRIKLALWTAALAAAGAVVWSLI